LPAKQKKAAQKSAQNWANKGLAVGGAVAVQASKIWLVSAATVMLNFLKNSMLRMGPATVACKNLAVKSLP
jgi:hypothetical protein